MEVVPISTLPLIPSFSKITKEDEKKKYWDKLIKDWGLPSHINHFPGSHPISIERKDLEFLKENKEKFLISLKSDGIRYIMYMTFRPDTEIPVCILIDRSKNMYEIEVWASEEFYEGTILDGELVWNLPNENSTTYLGFDILMLKGKSLKNKNYKERLSILDSIVYNNILNKKSEEIEKEIEENDQIVSVNNLHNLKISSKKFTQLSIIGRLWSDRLTHSFRQDGIILNKCDEEYKLGAADNTIFKWKPSYSIDVLIKNGCIYINAPKSEKLEVLESILGYNILILESKINYTEKDVVECDVKVNENSFLLFPMRVRLDKKFPNTLKTIKSSCESILDKVTIETLVEIFK